LKPITENQIQAGLFCLFEIIRQGNIGGVSFIIELQKDEWVMDINQSNIDLNTFDNFGGMSGCPVIFQGELMPLLAGIISEAVPLPEESGKICRFVARAAYSSIDENGKILRDIV